MRWRKDWLEPGDRTYFAELRALRERNDAIGDFLARIVLHTAYGLMTDDVMWPQIRRRRNGDVVLTWCNIIASFRKTPGGMVLDRAGTEIDWTYIRPDGRIMVLS